MNKDDFQAPHVGQAVFTLKGLLGIYSHTFATRNFV